MTESKTLLSIKGILHFEIKCGKCGVVFVIPRNAPNHDPGRVGPQGLTRCVWCNNPIPAKHQEALTHLLHSLTVLSEQSAPLFYFVFEQRTGD